MKNLAELGRTPSKGIIEMQMFKYLQRFFFHRKGKKRFEDFSRRRSGYRWMGEIYENKTGPFWVL